MATLRVVLALCALATAVCAYQPVPPGVVPLATFDGEKGTTWSWRLVNDPVMGGISKSTFNVDESGMQMNWKGEVKIVPKLAAPGFCNLETNTLLVNKANDARGTTHLLLRVKTSSPEYAGFKVSAAARTLNPQFASFKSNFTVPVGNNWTTVAVPWTSFSNDWSPFTGNCDTKDPTGKQHYCCSEEHPNVCITPADLKAIEQLGLWTEGVSGNFTLDIAWIGAGNMSALNAVTTPESEASEHNMTCSGPVQDTLRFNVTGLLAQDFLPLPALAKETLTEAVCCDSYFAPFAEPPNFFALPSIDMFSRLSKTQVNTFYDPVCGVPVFRAPVNRSFQDFEADTREHTWPSFREGEVTEHVTVRDDGTVVSSCGTKLGTYLPDSQGSRWCIDLVCIAGNPTN
eukprot:m.55106 g.55106  ORF g.55106 m.55106 type:complete len:400 (+) comp11466_c0_seq1:337-1536(+)